MTEEMSVLMVCAIAGTEYMQDYLESKVGAVRVKAFTDHHLFEETDLEEIWKMFGNYARQQKAHRHHRKGRHAIGRPCSGMADGEKDTNGRATREVYFHFDGQREI
ncbi:MAG: hypothetical protein R2788_18540 [Saprospiraceae bacterium]